MSIQQLGDKVKLLLPLSGQILSANLLILELEDILFRYFEFIYLFLGQLRNYHKIHEVYYRSGVWEVSKNLKCVW